MSDKFNEKLCDERHEEIQNKLKEIKIISWAVAAMTAGGLIIGISKQGADATNALHMIFKLIGV